MERQTEGETARTKIVEIHMAWSVEKIDQWQFVWQTWAALWETEIRDAQCQEKLPKSVLELQSCQKAYSNCEQWTSKWGGVAGFWDFSEREIKILKRIKPGKCSQFQHDGWLKPMMKCDAPALKARWPHFFKPTVAYFKTNLWACRERLPDPHKPTCW